MRTSLIFLSMFVLTLAACSKPTPLSGRYQARVGAIEFETSTALDIFIVGSSRWSGTFYAAKYEQSGSSLTVNTTNRSGNYTNTYYFKVIDDGAVLHLVKIKSLDRKTQKTEVQDAPDTDSNSFSKVLSK